MSERVVVLAGGLSPERDVSIRSGRRVAQELRDVGIDAQVCDVDAALLPALAADPPSCVIPLVHGAAGEDGALQDILAVIGIAFVGSDADACRRSFDKSIASALVGEAGVSVPESVALPQGMFRELGANRVLDALVARLGLPLVVKPTRGGSALGVAVVQDRHEFPAAMVGAFAYGDTVLVQRFVSGVEVAVGVIESAESVRALPVVEIVPDSGLYDYTARYTAGTTEFFVPARLRDDVLAAAQATAVTAHAVLRLRDWSRSDLIVDSDGTVWFLEVNVAPGMTETSLVPQAITADGGRMGDVMASLVRCATLRI